MVNLLGHQRSNDAQIVGHLPMPREKVADHLSALTVWLERRQMTLDFELLALTLSDWLPGRKRFRHRLATQAGLNQARINISSIPDSIYFQLQK